jgi:glycosyltransferase involved in cell wall biosynthesis
MKSGDRTVITVGLCVKNAEDTIGEAVSSISNQDYPHDKMEVIVVDGHSQDKTVRVIKESLSKTSIRTTYLFENVGLGFARQIVVARASGDYIIWVDGDIILSKDYVRNQVNFMETHPSVGIAVGSLGLLDGDNWVATLENVGYVIDSQKHHGKPTSKLLGTEGSIYRIEAVRQVGGFDPRIRGAQEDMDVAYRMRKAGWGLHITEAMFYERQRRTWKAIWRQHYWYGYGLHFMQHKNKGRNVLADKSIDRIILSSMAFRLTHRKVVFLLPLNFVFKKTALLFGMASAHLDGYGHN